MPSKGIRPARRGGSRRTKRTVAVVTMAVSFLAGVPAAVASFVDTGTATSTFTAAPDWVAPQASASVIAKATGYLAGAIKQGETYYVYANVTDSGNPPSGIATEKSDASTTTTGASDTTLTAGSFSVNGATYNYRSALLTANNPLTAGSKSFSIISTDVAGYTRTQGYTVTVDNTAPTATDVQTTNVGGGTNGRAQLGDTITFTFSEQIDPYSILSGWTGASTSVVVRLIDGGCGLGCSDDSFAIYNAANASQLPLGTVNLSRVDYNGTGAILSGTNSPITFGASGTPSTMVQSGSSITITLGTASATANTAGGNATMAWDSTTTPYDAAGNPASGNNPNEGGSADREF